MIRALIHLVAWAFMAAGWVWTIGVGVGHTVEAVLWLERHRCDQCLHIRPGVRVREGLVCCPVPLCNICAGIHSRYSLVGHHAP